MKRRFKDLSAEEVLALAISLEEEDARIFQELRGSCGPIIPRRPPIWIRSAKRKTDTAIG